MSDAVMQLNEVSFGYHVGEPVVEQVTADVLSGRLTAVIGPNAAGKTTLLKLMLGTLSPTRGSIGLNGRKLRKVAAGDRAAMMSYVPQRSSANFAFTVEHVVAMGRFALPWHGQAMTDAMAACDLEKLRRKPFVELSAGQQQRVLLARAMCQATGGGRVMLLDEPTSAMDLRHVHQTMDRLTKLRDAGLAVVVVMHDLNLAARYADAVWLMNEGRLAAAGSWDQVLRPAVLEPVYGVKIEEMQGRRDLGTEGRSEDMIRPVFDARLAEEKQE